MRKESGKIVDNPLMKSHPEKCPKCGSEIVYFERFINGGSYCCDDCDWQVSAYIDPRIERKLKLDGEKGE